jgi:hypothetical protein
MWKKAQIVEEIGLSLTPFFFSIFMEIWHVRFSLPDKVGMDSQR